MSLKKNILANYASQFYVTLIGIVMVPLYITYMGAEAYGLVGFYAMLQAWFMLLDIGLTPTITRESARFHGGATDALSYRRLVRALEGVFLIVALVGGAAMFAASGYIVDHWLRASRLPTAEVQTAVQLIAIIIAMRWLCGLYRGVVSGSERLVWLGGYNSTISTLRFVAVLPALMFIGAAPTIFFGFQLGVAVIELAALLFYAYRLLPSIPEGQRLPLDWSPLKPVLKFSLTIAFTSSVMVLVTQTDKLVLSTLLPLEEYGYFTLAVLVASGVIAITSPISVALLPRMSKLNAEKDDLAMIRLYRNATQLVSVIAIPTTLVLAFFAEQVLWVWTGDSEIARKAAPVLTLYALGNGFFTLAAFGYYLQFAKGDLKLHVLGNLFFAVIFVPLLLWTVREYGMIGAGYAWLIANLLPFVLWLPIVHRRFFKGLHTKWLFRDVMPVLVFPTAAAFVVNENVPWPKTQLMAATCIVAVSAGLCAIAALCSSWCRETLRNRWRARFET